MNEKDLSMFCSAVCGKAASSGKMTPESIQTWLQFAKDAWEEVFGKAVAAAPEAPYGGAPGHISATANKVMARLSANDITPSTQPWDTWKNEKAFFGKRDETVEGKPVRDLTWAEIANFASSGNEWCRKALNYMGYKQKIDPASPHADRNEIQVSRAKVALTHVTPF